MCSDPILLALNRFLARAYQQALQVLPSSAILGLRATEDRWIIEREKCLDKVCVAAMLRNRTTELQGMLDAQQKMLYAQQQRAREEQERARIAQQQQAQQEAENRQQQYATYAAANAAYAAVEAMKWKQLDVKLDQSGIGRYAGPPCANPSQTNYRSLPLDDCAQQVDQAITQHNAAIEQQREAYLAAQRQAEADVQERLKAEPPEFVNEYNACINGPQDFHFGHSFITTPRGSSPPSTPSATPTQAPGSAAHRCFDTAEAVIKNRREKAAAAAKELAQAEEDGPKFVAQYGIQWSLESKTDEMSDSKILRSVSKQTSDDNEVLAQIAITCKGASKDLDMRATFFNAKGEGVDLLDAFADTNRTQKVYVEARFGSQAPSPVFVLPLGDFSNEIILAIDPMGELTRAFAALAAISHSNDAAAQMVLRGPTEADLMLRYPRLLYKVRTNKGDIVIKVLPYDPNVLPVVKACAKNP